MTKRDDYLIAKIDTNRILYLLDELQNPRSFNSKEAALQYMEVSSEEKLKEKGFTIEPYSLFSDF